MNKGLIVISWLLSDPFSCFEANFRFFHVNSGPVAARKNLFSLYIIEAMSFLYRNWESIKRERRPSLREDGAVTSRKRDEAHSRSLFPAATEAATETSPARTKARTAGRTTATATGTGTTKATDESHL